MTHDPDRIDPTDQSGRPGIILVAFVALIVVVALMGLVWLLA